jgi:hypothetical protein
MPDVELQLITGGVLPGCVLVARLTGCQLGKSSRAYHRPGIDVPGCVARRRRFHPFIGIRLLMPVGKLRPF